MVTIVPPCVMRMRKQFDGRGTTQEVQKNSQKQGCVHRNGPDMCR